MLTVIASFVMSFLGSICKLCLLFLSLFVNEFAESQAEQTSPAVLCVFMARTEAMGPRQAKPCPCVPQLFSWRGKAGAGTGQRGLCAHPTPRLSARL